MIKTSLKKHWNKAFFTNVPLQTYGCDRKRFDQNRKTCTYKALVVALKKETTQDFMPFFQILSLFSRLLPGQGNCSANFRTFSRIHCTMYINITRCYTNVYHMHDVNCMRRHIQASNIVNCFNIYFIAESKVT